MAYCLRNTGALKQVGKLGGAWLYEQNAEKPRDFRAAVS